MKSVYFNERGMPISVYQGEMIDAYARELPTYIEGDGNIFQLWRDPATKEIHERIFVHLTLDKMRIIADGEDCITVTGMPEDGEEWAMHGLIVDGKVRSSEPLDMPVALEGKYESDIFIVRAAPYEFWLEELRTERNQRLTACDWTAVADNGLSPEKREAWATYRKALRDLTTEQPKATLDTVDWPVAP